jgi:hypothetical protein
MTASDFRTKADVKASLGEPKSVVQLPPERDPCKERWFYLGKVNIQGLGPLDVMSYLDFDGLGNVCKSSPRT